MGIIGCGNVVEQYHLPVLVSNPGAKIRWLCDSSADRARRLARTWNMGPIFERVDACSEVDAVLIATPVGSRGGILAQTTNRGWHALCEKPFAASASEHHHFLDCAVQRGVKLGAGYMRRYYWSVGQAREMLRSQVLGPLRSIVASDSAHLERTGVDLSSYRNSAAASGGGVLAETGCHLIDQVLFVADAIGVDVEACAQRFWNDYEVETSASAIITLRSRRKVPLQFAVSGVKPIFAGMAFRCELGEIRLRIDAAQGLDVFLGQALTHAIHVPHPHPREKPVFVAFRREWVHFLEAIRGNVEWDIQRATGLLTSEFIVQCNDRAKPSVPAGVCD